MNAVVPDYSYVPDFRPTHVVPRDGLPAWEAPDPALPTAPLDAFLPVQLLDRVGDWGQVLCSNGWSAWVDARLLVSVPADPPAAGSPLTRTADPRPLIARAEDALGRFRRAVEELAAGRADGETFRQRTRGLRVGMVVDGEAVWLYDAEHERWVFCDGAGLSTYAAASGPSVAARTPSGVTGSPASPASPLPAGSSGSSGSPGPAVSPRSEGAERSGAFPGEAAHAPTQVVPELSRPPDDGPAATQVVPELSRPPDDGPGATQVVPELSRPPEDGPGATQVVQGLPPDGPGED
ncbi:hypothetical protein ACIGO8_12135 [Streptomyces sp. NPDC053493]|uniref:hypothetical protein n=1 Tax=Streptomyces sp. NPDC053493 TaxID=3365705 RepID=UPI0037CF3A62